MIFQLDDNNIEIHSQLKQLMEQGKKLTIQLDDEPCAWISTYRVTSLRYSVNNESWRWLLNYLKTGNSDDFGINPNDLPPLPNFQEKVLRELINCNECVARIPFLRETTAYISLVGIFKFGKVTFRIKRTNEFVEYLYEKQIC
jgi:hypothetical protein